MDVLKTALLAVLQGLTEFLPVSSSGHLVILERLLSMKRSGLALEVALHLGTVLAVIVVYWSEIRGIVADSVGALRSKTALENPSVRFVFVIIVASIPTGIIGLLAKDVVDRMFSTVLPVGMGLIVTAVALRLTRFASDGEARTGEIGLLRAVVVGIAQGIAVMPGISRSGATLACGLLVGIERESAAKFSFLLSVPAVLGASVLELRHVGREGMDWIAIGVGVVVAFAVGYLALRLLLRFVKGGRLYVFSYYCYPLGLLTILAWSLGLL